MILKSVDIKQGATLSLGGYINLPIDDWTVSSEVRTPAGELVSTLGIELLAPVAPSEQYTIAILANDTDTWPIGTLYCDIRFVTGDFVLTTPTFDIVVSETQTYA